MKKKKNKKKNLGNIILDFVRDALFGGNEYETIKGQSVPFPFATIAGVAITTVLFLALVFSLIKTSELSTDIASMKKQLISLEAKADNLQGEFSKKYPFTEIQQYAEENGFTSDGGRTILLPNEEEEKTEEQPAENTDSLMNILSSVFQKIKQFFQ